MRYLRGMHAPRMSLHRARIEEASSAYSGRILRRRELRWRGRRFRAHEPAFEEYALAGILHLDHLAGLAGSNLHRRVVRRVARETADALGGDMATGERQLGELLARHRAEWLDFQLSLRQPLLCQSRCDGVAMAMTTGSLSAAAVGDLLREARENAKITQATAALALNVARTTLVAMEQGQRRARVDELQKLAALYGTSLNELLRQDSAKVDLRPRFRKIGEQGEQVEAAIVLLNNLVQAEVELENLLGVTRARTRSS